MLEAQRHPLPPPLSVPLLHASSPLRQPKKTRRRGGGGGGGAPTLTLRRSRAAATSRSAACPACLNFPGPAAVSAAFPPRSRGRTTPPGEGARPRARMRMMRMRGVTLGCARLQRTRPRAFSRGQVAAAPVSTAAYLRTTFKTHTLSRRFAGWEEEEEEWEGRGMADYSDTYRNGGLRCPRS